MSRIYKAIPRFKLNSAQDELTDYILDYLITNLNMTDEVANVSAEMDELYQEVVDYNLNAEMAAKDDNEVDVENMVEKVEGSECRGLIGPTRLEMFQIFLVLVRPGSRFFIFFRSWSSPRV